MIKEPEIVTLKIIHFNDVYNIEEQVREPRGGVARFCSAVESFRDANTLTIFGGDALSPSTLSTQTRGRHMVDFLNCIKVDCAVYGNHDFDFGEQNLMECAALCKFPWLLSNCLDKETRQPLANGKMWHIMEMQGVKIGMIGLIEPEWMDTLSMVDAQDVDVEDFCKAGARLADTLRIEHGCHLIFAITHMRWPNDILLAQKVPGIDLILGGHDHNSGVETINGHLVVKSGADFREFSRLQLTISLGDQVRLTDSSFVELVTVDSRWPVHPRVDAMVQEHTAKMESMLGQPLGHVAVELECRFDVLRRQECNLGNWIADIMLMGVSADVAVLNAGTLRADCIFPIGDFTYRDLGLLLPFTTTIVVQRVTGSQLIQVLENAVSQVPRLEGRFPVVSGVTFAFNPNHPPGNRIITGSVVMGSETTPIEPESNYRLAIQAYMAKGGDGFDVLADCPLILDEENGPSLNNCVINFFRAVEVVNKMKSTSASRFLVNRASRNDGRKGENSSKWNCVRDVVDHSCDSVVVGPKVEGRIQEVSNDAHSSTISHNSV